MPYYPVKKVYPNVTRYEKLLAVRILKTSAALSEIRPSMMGVILHFDFAVPWELLHPNLERRISLNVLSCDYENRCSEIGIFFFTAVHVPR